MNLFRRSRTRQKQYYMKNGAAVLEELIAVCDGKSRIPLRYFSAIEIKKAIKHTETKMASPWGYMFMGSLEKRRVLIRFFTIRVRVQRDIAITSQMSHLKNVLRLVGCCLEFETPVMVYEYVETVSLQDLLFTRWKHVEARKSLLCWGSRLRIANEVASTIVFLHTEFTTPIIHRDLRPATVLIDQNSGVSKIVDFSLSIPLPLGKLEAQEPVCGTIGYLDPVYALSGIVSQKSDVYSFGILLFQLLTGKNVEMTDGKMKDHDVSLNNRVESNIEECNIMDIVDPAILEEHGNKIQQQLEDYLDLVKKCTALQGEDRPYMLHVAKELRRIEKCFRSLSLC